MKKQTNESKIIKALKSGPKTQAELMRQTKVKNVYQVVSDLKAKGTVFMDTAKCVNLVKVPVVVDETTKVSSEQLKATLPKPESDIIKMLKSEVENIQDGIRSLMVTRSYLLRRIEEEKRDA